MHTRYISIDAHIDRYRDIVNGWPAYDATLCIMMCVGWPRCAEVYRPRVGAVPYQAHPLLGFFMCKIRTCQKSEKGEEEPGNKAIDLHIPPGHRHNHPIFLD